MGVGIGTGDLALRRQVDRSDLHVAVRRLPLIVDPLDRGNLRRRGEMSRSRNQILNQQIQQFVLMQGLTQVGLMMQRIDQQE